jgi:hypothetical protein
MLKWRNHRQADKELWQRQLRTSQGINGICLNLGYVPTVNLMPRLFRFNPPLRRSIRIGYGGCTEFMQSVKKLYALYFK